MPTFSRPVSFLALFTLAFTWSLVVLPAASAQYFGRNKVQYDEFDFQRFDTEHFEIYFYPEEEQKVKDVARMAERWYGRHSRTYLREFDEQKPLIFYANHADFQQTNAISGQLSEGTGGVTESLKERVVMPLTGIYSETDHVLGHELVHSFQYDIGLADSDSIRFSLGLIPLWLIEGTAEYLSVGRRDPHTAMWLRDAAIRDDLPTIDDLTRSNKYFPYRYGQAYMAYIGGKYGDAAVTNLYKLAGRTGLDSAFVYTLGIKADSLSKEWIQAVKDTYLPLVEGRTPFIDAGRPVLNEDINGGRMNIAPVLSPDGKYVAYLSERDIFNINLFVADAETGQVVKKLRSMSRNPEFDAIQFINSAGTWSPDGEEFAFVTFAQGDNEVTIWNLDSGNIERRVKVEGVSALSNPAWSPDGKQIAFSGIDGGISDIYLLDVETNAVRQVTNDRYADLQPAWSPDGQTLAVVTDRGPEGTNFATLKFGEPRLSLINVETGEIEVIRPFTQGKQINPQFAPDGRSVYFVSDQDGFSDIYRYMLETKETLRITRLQTGVSGITGMSPAMSVAMQSGRMLFSVFSNNTYSVFAMEPEDLEGRSLTLADIQTAPTDLALNSDGNPIPGETADTPLTGPSIAGLLPPVGAYGEGLVSNYLEDPLTGLPENTDYEVKNYSSRLRLDYVAPPTVGVAAGGLYGSGIAGGVGFFFSDMLGNQNLTVVAQANGTFKDIGGQAVYMNQGKRFNWGGAVGHIPILFGSSGFRAGPIPGTTELVELRQRIFIDRLVGIGSYPLTSTRRFEVNAGFVRYGFDYEEIVFTFDNLTGAASRQRNNLNEFEPDDEYFFQTAAAYVGDFSNFGFTSPLQGGRYRFQVAPQVGTATYVTALADYRRYFFAKPFTFAVRGLHIGNYGADQDDIFAEEYLGYSYYPGFVRGYSFNSIDTAEECTEELLQPNETGGLSCSITTALRGTRSALVSAEVRLPFLGTESLGLLNFPYLPTELTLFSDAGLAWNEGDNPFKLLEFADNLANRVPVVSAGASARMNILGYIILEVFYAYPFQRPEKGGHFGVQLSPGW